MGILARLRGNKEQKREDLQPIQPVWQPRMSVREIESKDGRKLVGVESYDPKTHANEFYDTTHAIIDKTPVRLQSGEVVYNAYVSHYSEEDAIMIDKKSGRDLGRRNNFKHVRIGLDFDKLKNDPAYAHMVMDVLLDENRIYKYINEALADQKYSGNYVGEVAMIDGKYRKQFTPSIGNEVHFMPDQIRDRAAYREREERSRQAQIAAKKAEIAKAQEELRKLQEQDSDGR